MIRFLITDDEPLAHRVLERLAAPAPDLQHVASGYDATESRALLTEYRPDLWFLDIRMPGVTGLELLRSLDNPPLVVLTTAYAEFALEGFALEVVDYLLKPIDRAQFQRAVDRVRRRLAAEPEARLAFREGRERHFFFPREIAFAQSEGHFTRLHLINGSKLLISEGLNALADRLTAYDFIRIHRSYLINRAHVRSLQRDRITVGNHELPIGRTYRGLDF